MHAHQVGERTEILTVEVAHSGYTANVLAGESEADLVRGGQGSVGEDAQDKLGREV